MAAKGAFFHNPFGSKGDIPIEGPFHLLWPFRLVPIEILYGIGARRRAIAASDAAVIDLGHQPFFIFVSGIDGADFRAGGMVAVHARSREKSCFDIGIFAFNIRDQFDPVNGSTLRRLFRSNESDVIFCVAGHHAGLASGAFVEINHHSPTRHTSLPKCQISKFK
jgi:hypothetical protein